MQPLVIYDGDCDFCVTAVNFAKTKVAVELNYLPAAKVKLSNYGLTPAACQQALQFVAPDHKIAAAEAAVIQILRHGSLSYRILGLIMNLPVIKILVKYGYKLVAQNRNRFNCRAATCHKTQGSATTTNE